MPSKRKHCPFLNRADHRCSEAFSLDNLDHAFRCCFGRYQACTIYLEMLVERRARRSSPGQSDLPEDHDALEPLVKVSIRRTKANTNAQQPADRPGVSAVFGL